MASRRRKRSEGKQAVAPHPDKRSALDLVAELLVLARGYDRLALRATDDQSRLLGHAGNDLLMAVAAVLHEQHSTASETKAVKRGRKWASAPDGTHGPPMAPLAMELDAQPPPAALYRQAVYSIARWRGKLTNFVGSTHRRRDLCVALITAVERAKDDHDACRRLAVELSERDEFLQRSTEVHEFRERYDRMLAAWHSKPPIASAVIKKAKHDPDKTEKLRRRSEAETSRRIKAVRDGLDDDGFVILLRGALNHLREEYRQPIGESADLRRRFVRRVLVHVLGLPEGWVDDLLKPAALRPNVPVKEKEGDGKTGAPSANSESEP